MSYAIDPELLEEFLTEAGELIEQLDADLVELESQPDSMSLLDQIFRALHTIKGAASFLSLAELVEFAHAAEDALNKLRKGERDVDQSTIDAMLQSVDVLRGQLEEISAGTQMTAGPAPLLEALRAIANDAPSEEQPTTSSAQENSTPDNTPPPFGATRYPLSLGPEKQDLLPFMVDDLDDFANALETHAPGLADQESAQEAAKSLAELAAGAAAVAEFFDLDAVKSFTNVIAAFETGFAPNPDNTAELGLRITAIATLTVELAKALRNNQALAWPLDTFEQSSIACIAGSSGGAPHNDFEQLLAAEGIAASTQQQELIDTETEEHPATTTDHNAPAEAAPNQEPDPDTPPPNQPEKNTTNQPQQQQAVAAEQSVRVEVSRLETLLNLVGEMVLTKNQVLGCARGLREHTLPQEMVEQVMSVASDLDRLTSELQMGVMRTRMQPLNKLFGRYPRIVRDLSRKTGKQAQIVIEGGDTEVDKSVLELLGDPLVHMIRNSCDHGLESPEERQAAGKDPSGTVVLSASHEGGHVRVTISDDGRGIDREVIASKAIEKGLTTPEQAAQLSDSDVFKFIFAAGFSTAAQVSDLSGRGVGMDVVRTNIGKLNGQIEIRSTKGEGSTFDILIPLTVAIMPAMLVRVAAAEYAIPLTTIYEIVKPDTNSVESIAGYPSFRLRNEVLPLIDLRTTLAGTEQPADSTGFAVVVGVGDQKAGLLVDHLLGQQEIVIKPLDDNVTNEGPFSGATILENGRVSLIIDVVQVIKNITRTTEHCTQTQTA